MYVEWKQLMLMKEKSGSIKEYFTNFMNCLDLTAYVISIVLIFLSILNLDIPTIQSRCILASMIALMMWVKMLEWLRVFDSTAFFIKLIG